MKYYTILIFACSLLFACNSKTTTNSEPAASESRAPEQSNAGEFLLTGYFNIDAVMDTVYEMCYSDVTHTPIQMHEVGMGDSADNVLLIMKQKPVTMLYTSMRGVDTFVVTKEPQQQGLSILMNLGDLNGDGTDEIGYVVNWADFTNLNTYHIITLKGKQFTELFSFAINEELSFNSENLIDSTKLVKPISSNTIAYKFYSDTATIETGTYRFKE